MRWRWTGNLTQFLKHITQHSALSRISYFGIHKYNHENSLDLYNKKRNIAPCLGLAVLASNSATMKKARVDIYYEISVTSMII